MDDAQDAAHKMDPDLEGVSVSDMVKLLSEIDNLAYVDKLVQVGRAIARDHRQELQDFVRHTLFCQQNTL